MEIGRRAEMLWYRVGTAGHIEPCARIVSWRSWLRKKDGPNSEKGTEIRHVIVPERERKESRIITAFDHSGFHLKCHWMPIYS